MVFLQTPSSPYHENCVRQAVLRLDFTGLFNKVTFTLDYEHPRLWTFHLADLPTADGHGPVGMSNASMNSSRIPIEVYLFNRQFSARTDVMEGLVNSEVGALAAVQMVDGVLNKGRSKVTMTLSEDKLEWAPNKGPVEVVKWRRWSFPDGHHPVVYAGFNRIVGGSWRTGSGLCRVNVVMSREEGKYESVVALVYCLEVWWRHFRVVNCWCRISTFGILHLVPTGSSVSLDSKCLNCLKRNC